MEKEFKASDYKCVKCGKQAEVWFPVCDPDIKPHPYCKECADKAYREIMFNLYNAKCPY